MMGWVSCCPVGRSLRPLLLIFLQLLTNTTLTTSTTTYHRLRVDVKVLSEKDLPENEARRERRMTVRKAVAILLFLSFFLVRAIK